MTADTAPAGTPRLTLQGGRATITLQRPAQHNRLHVEDLLALQQQVAALRDEPGLRVLVLTAEGRSFSSGFHLGAFDQARAGDAPHLFERTVEAIEALPLPTVCRLNGSVYGGAVDLALACDFRVGVAGMQLRMPAVRLGLHYYAGGLQRAVAKLGLRAAKRLFLLAETLPAAELLAIGYLDRLAGDGRLDAEVDAIADALAAAAPLALHGMKASLDEIARGDCRLSALREREARCAASADLREGIAAQAGKREPRFSGR